MIWNYITYWLNYQFPVSALWTWAPCVEEPCPSCTPGASEESGAQKFLDKCSLNELENEIEAPADIGSQAHGDISFSLEFSSLLTHERSSSNQTDQVLSPVIVHSGWNWPSQRRCTTVARDWGLEARAFIMMNIHNNITTTYLQPAFQPLGN